MKCKYEKYSYCHSFQPLDPHFINQIYHTTTILNLATMCKVCSILVSTKFSFHINEER